MKEEGRWPAYVLAGYATQKLHGGQSFRSRLTNSLSKNGRNMNPCSSSMDTESKGLQQKNEDRNKTGKNLAIYGLLATKITSGPQIQYNTTVSTHQKLHSGKEI